MDIYRGKKSSKAAMKLKNRSLYARQALSCGSSARKARADPVTGLLKSGRPKRLIPKASPRKYVPKITGAKRGRPKKSNFTESVHLHAVDLSCSEDTEDIEVGETSNESSNVIDAGDGEYDNRKSCPTVTTQTEPAEASSFVHTFEVEDRIKCISGKYRSAIGKVVSVDEDFINVALEDVDDDNRINFERLHISAIKKIDF